MNVVREINKINEAELKLGVSGSWHDEYKDSAYVFVGGLNTELTEGDVITIMSQYGEISNINLPRHKDTGAPRGFAFVMYLDQRSTILAVDNLNGAQVLGRTLRVDHVKGYKQSREKNEEGEWVDKDDEEMNALPWVVGIDTQDNESEEDKDDGIDPDDPMADYLRAQKRAEKEKNKDKKRKHDGESKEQRRARKLAKKEKKDKKGKGASEGMKAVEALLAGWEGKNRGRDDSRTRSPEPEPEPDRRHARSPSPQRRRLDVSPPLHRRDNTASRRSDSSRLSSPARRRDATPPRRNRAQTPPRRPRDFSPQSKRERRFNGTPPLRR